MEFEDIVIRIREYTAQLRESVSNSRRLREQHSDTLSTTHKAIQTSLDKLLQSDMTIKRMKLLGFEAHEEK